MDKNQHKNSRLKVGLYCLDTVGRSMAGPAIRYWEFAKVLSRTFDVTLFVPNTPDITGDGFNLVPHHYIFPKSLSGMDLIITQSINWMMAYQAKKRGIKLILDAYDPEVLEHLEICKNLSLNERIISNSKRVEDHRLSFQMADGFICASEKQKDLWMGSLMSLGRITPQHYEKNTSLKNLIDVVPFGLSSIPPVKSGGGFREKFNLSKNDKIIVWGGGIWNWFDPLTLIEGIKILSRERSDIKLVFMGLKHPNETISEMEMCARAVSLAKELGLIDKHVFFNYGWVPYEERQNYLLDAEIGVSTHLDHLETRYSFRTRMLDYIWAGLPIIGTTGDSFADLIQANNLGVVVPYNDSQAIADAMKKIIDNPGIREEMTLNLREISSRFHWNSVVRPLEDMVEFLTSQSRGRIQVCQIHLILKSLLKRVHHVRQDQGFVGVIKAVKKKLLCK